MIFIKKMNHVMQSKYLLLKDSYLLTIVFYLISTVSSEAQSKDHTEINLVSKKFRKEELIKSAILSLSILDLEDEVHLLAKDSSYIIILKNNRSCLSCFSILSKSIFTYCNDNFIQILSLTCVDSSFLERKRMYKQNLRLMPEVAHHYFYISSHSNFLGNKDALQAEDNLFSQWGVQITPALLLVNRNNVMLIEYPEILNLSDTGISDAAEKKIIQFYNK
jgi:hypothetical protein